VNHYLTVFFSNDSISRRVVQSHAQKWHVETVYAQ